MRLRRIDVVQYGWNMFDRRMQARDFPVLRGQQIGVMAYGSLAYGMLTGTFHADMQFEESDWRSKRGMLGSLNLFRTMFGPEHFPRNLQAVEELKALAAKYGKTLAAIRAALDARAIPVDPHRAGRLPPPGGGGRRTSARSAGQSRNADMAEIDAIFARTARSPCRRAGWRTIRSTEANRELSEETPCRFNASRR